MISDIGTAVASLTEAALIPGGSIILLAEAGTSSPMPGITTYSCVGGVLGLLTGSGEGDHSAPGEQRAPGIYSPLDLCPVCHLPFANLLRNGIKNQPNEYKED